MTLPLTAQPFDMPHAARSSETAPAPERSTGKLRRHFRRYGAVALGLFVAAGTTIGLSRELAASDISRAIKYGRELNTSNAIERQNMAALNRATDAVQEANQNIGMPVLAIQAINHGQVTVLQNECHNPIALKTLGITSSAKKARFASIVTTQVASVQRTLNQVKVVQTCDQRLIHPDQLG